MALLCTPVFIPEFPYVSGWSVASVSPSVLLEVPMPWAQSMFLKLMLALQKPKKRAAKNKVKQEDEGRVSQECYFIISSHLLRHPKIIHVTHWPSTLFSPFCFFAWPQIWQEYSWYCYAFHKSIQKLCQSTNLLDTQNAWRFYRYYQSFMKLPSHFSLCESCAQKQFTAYSERGNEHLK